MKVIIIFALVLLTGCVTRNIPIETKIVVNEEGEKISKTQRVFEYEIDENTVGAQVVESGLHDLSKSSGFSGFFRPSQAEYAYAKVWNGAVMSWHEQQEVVIYSLVLREDGTYESVEINRYNPVPFPSEMLYEPQSALQRQEFGWKEILLAFTLYSLLNNEDVF